MTKQNTYRPGRKIPTTKLIKIRHTRHIGVDKSDKVCYNEDMMNKEQLEAIETVIATANGNSYGLTVEDQLAASQMAARLLAQAFPAIVEKVEKKMMIKVDK